MASSLNTTIRNANMANIVAEAGANAIIRAYNGARPAGLGALSGNTLIAEATCAATLGTVSAGVLTFNTIAGDSSADASGTPTFIRVFKSDGTSVVSDHDTPAFPACTAGQPVNFNLLTITDGNP